MPHPYQDDHQSGRGLADPSADAEGPKPPADEVRMRRGVPHAPTNQRAPGRSPAPSEPDWSEAPTEYAPAAAMREVRARIARGASASEIDAARPPVRNGGPVTGLPSRSSRPQSDEARAAHANPGAVGEEEGKRGLGIFFVALLLLVVITAVVYAI